MRPSLLMDISQLEHEFAQRVDAFARYTLFLQQLEAYLGSSILVAAAGKLWLFHASTY